MMFNMIKRFVAAYNWSHHFRRSLVFAITFHFKKKSVFVCNKRKIIIRNNYSDEKVFYNVFVNKYHLPPIKLVEGATIVDLGSNIGLTLLDFHLHFPMAKIYGVEMDLENYEIGKTNTYGIENIDLRNLAIYTSDAILNYSGKDARSFKISDEQRGGLKAKGITMNGLIDLLKIDKIDYLKIDIEGTERAIIMDESAQGWLGKVDVINVELHDHLGSFSFKEEIIRKLNNVGFRVWEHPSHFNALVAIKI
ncbi:MAG: FkbM family methyltransferase [Saprospiraceae bacterium]|nr:MAG: FkbM family methyltransferase [Bacteroidetes bacterium OLB9]MCO6462778.1 FkbM family methyltransferase [Saprospiraceae bacterium]MCZ2338083.1 FkbM family methyltransferase [Chitinophagales bacterium]